MSVLVTGANGFVGRALCRRLGMKAVAAVRPGSKGCEAFLRCDSPPLGAEADWRAAVAGRKAVVHLAARVHVMHESSHDPLAEFRAANVAGTLRLAEQAAAAGVDHFVFLSSVKACGEATFGTPFGPKDSAPVDPYGVSKLEAEEALAKLAAWVKMPVTILRPPLVYGPGVKGNFRSLIKLIDKRIPLPLGLVDNRRSLIGLGNLVDAITACLDKPPAPGETRVFTLCDDETVSSAGLVRHLAYALGRTPRLLPVPLGLLRLAGRLTGKSAAIQRLTGSLEVESKTIRDTIGWTPPESLEYGLGQTARWWRSKEIDPS